MTPNPKDDFKENIETLFYRFYSAYSYKKTESLRKEIIGLHFFHSSLIGQQTAQEIFKEIDSWFVSEGIITCVHYKEIKQKYIGDNKQ